MILKCLKGPLQGQDFAFDPGVTYAIGREPGGDFSVTLDSATVSSQHAEICEDSGAWLIRDLNSRNGIRVNKLLVQEAYLTHGDRLDIGEYRFEVHIDQTADAVELAADDPWANDQMPAEEVASVWNENQANLNDSESQNQERSVTNRMASQKSSNTWLKILKLRIRQLDFIYKVFFGLFAFAITAHFIISIPYFQESEKRLLQEAIRTAKAASLDFSYRFKTEMAAGQFHLVDCVGFQEELNRNEIGVTAVYALDVKQNLVCPLGKTFEASVFVEEAEKRNRLVSDCPSMLTDQTKRSCRLAAPIRYQFEGESFDRLVGFVVLDYEPTKVFQALQKMQSLRWQTLALVLILVSILGVLLRNRLLRAIKRLTEDVNLLYTGTSQKVEKIHGFNALTPLIESINRLIAKINQGLSQGAESSDAEASFLQPFFEQMFLLEERAMIAIDSDNVILAVTEFAFEVIPLQETPGGVHITEAVGDTHLQGEMMSFLSDLSATGEILDRPLSLNDRVIQARGMPIYQGGNHVANLLVFYQ